MTGSPSPELDIGLAVALPPTALDDGLQRWLQPVVDGVFDSVWSLENPLTPQAEPLVWLTAAALLCPEARVGTAAVVAPIRDPVLLARQAATIGRLTGGRFDLGVTIGRRRSDYDVVGRDFDRRGRLLDESIERLRSIWNRTGEAPPAGPPPGPGGGPQVLIGGHAEAALDRAIRLGDGFLAGATSGPQHAVASLGRLLTLAAERGVPPPARAVANVFVMVGDSPAKALARARRIVADRHGGKPAWDVDAAIVAGPARLVAERLWSMHIAGFSGINLVPVDMTLGGVQAAAGIASLLSDLGTGR